MSVTFDGSNVHFTFGIPRGNDGAPGFQGPPGGEGNNSDLNNALSTAISGTSSNSNAVGT